MSKVKDTGWQVPAHKVDVLGRKAHKAVMIVPVLNEGERLARVLAKTRAVLDSGVALDVVVADGGSKDGSVAHEKLRAAGVRALLTKTGKGKLSAQLRMAYAWALREGYTQIVTIDGNDKDDPADVVAILAALEAGHAYVQASRFIKGGVAVNTPPVRWLAIRLVHAPVISLLAGQWFTDTTQGFRGYSSAYLLHEGVQPFRDVFGVYELLAYLSVRATQLGMTAVEVPTTRIYPEGEVPTKISALRGNLDLLVTLWRLAMRQYHPERA